ncbi:MAG: hypothetical protein OHK0013_31170 [Sandaracinaceae bacterium]
MKPLHPFVVLALATLVPACGGSSSQSTETAQQEQGAGGEQHPAGHPRIPANLSALHGVLAPTWHSEAGATRAGLACTNAARLDEESRMVSSSSPPEGVDVTAWGAAVEQLTATSAALVAECAASGPAVEERLSTFHDAFHALLDLQHGG